MEVIKNTSHSFSRYSLQLDKEHRALHIQRCTRHIVVCWCFLCRCLYGGASKGTQARQLYRNPQLLIATPGRLLDFVHTGEVNLSKVRGLQLA